MSRKPIVLCVLDGWGESQDGTNNAVLKARLPNWCAWKKKYPYSMLKASGDSVGLPSSQMGNSEVGHTTIGAGRVVLQDLPRIHQSISNDTLKNLPALVSLKKTHRSQTAYHLMGLFSPGGVHSHSDHMWALCKILAPAPIKLHLWLDGRDTPPKSAVEFLEDGICTLSALPHVKIATLMGRYYAMDRDKRWDRTEQAFNAMILGQGTRFKYPVSAIQHCYGANQTDEFITPMVSETYHGMAPHDELIAFNFRADRMRQILSALLLPDFNSFPRPANYVPPPCTGMKSYADFLSPHINVLFSDVAPNKTLGSVIADHGVPQLRIAETEKYAHVTFFFNGGVEESFSLEDRILLPSPKVKTYDLKPEMAAYDVTKALCVAIREKEYGFALVNYANPDMVGHTGNMKATIQALEIIDTCLKQLYDTILEKDGVLIITADHGNVEKMFDQETQQPHTAHTCNPVPFLVACRESISLKKTGTLADIAPTILDLLHLDKPQDMSGQSLLCA